MSLQSLPTEITERVASYLDQPSRGALAAASRQLYEAVLKPLHRELDLTKTDQASLHALYVKLARCPRIRNHVRYITFGVGATESSSAIPYEDSRKTHTRLDFLLGSFAPKETRTLWRAAMFDEEVGAEALKAYIACVCSNVESITYHGTFDVPQQRTFLRLVDSVLASRPILAKLKGFYITSPVDETFPLLPQLQTLSLHRVDSCVSLYLTSIPPLQSQQPALQDIELLNCDGAINAVSTALGTFDLPLLRKVKIVEKFWDPGLDSQTLVDRLASGCRELTSLELDFVHYDPEDDDAVIPLEKNSFGQFQALKSLRVHRDLRHYRDDRNIVQDLAFEMPNTLDTLHIVGLRRRDILDAVNRQLAPKTADSTASLVNILLLVDGTPTDEFTDILRDLEDLVQRCKGLEVWCRDVDGESQVA